MGKSLSSRAIGWAIEWRSDSALDGKRRCILGIGHFGAPLTPLPDCYGAYHTMVFRSRAKAREFIRRRYGYIAERPDLRREPHGWKMPRPVRVRVDVIPL